MRNLLWAGEGRDVRLETPGLTLRRSDDGMTFVEDRDLLSRDAIEVVPRRTPWRIRVVSVEGRSTWLDNTFPSIDASEHGIEAIQVVSLRMDPENVLLDGEVLEKTDALVRRPVALLRLGALRAVYKRDGGLGQLISTGSKVLPTMSRDDIRTSDVEARLARTRRRNLDMQTGHVGLDAGREGSHLTPGSERLQALVECGLDPKLQMDRLAPVTWTTLEALFALEARQSR